MSIEINEIVVQTRISEESSSGSARNAPDLTRDLEKMKTQILSQCKELFFELLNEPFGDFTDELWNQYLTEGLELIRETNPSRTVIIGPGGWNSISHLDSLILPENDRNIIVAIHYYSPESFTFQGAAWADRSDSRGIQWLGTEEEKQVVIEDFEKAQNWSEKNNRPIFLGEFGVYDTAEIDSRTRYLSFKQSQRIDS